MATLEMGCHDMIRVEMGMGVAGWCRSHGLVRCSSGNIEPNEHSNDNNVAEKFIQKEAMLEHYISMRMVSSRPCHLVGK